MTTTIGGSPAPARRQPVAGISDRAIAEAAARTVGHRPTEPPAAADQDLPKAA